MTPTQILALVRDIIVVVGIGFLLWKVYVAGENADLKQDMQALQKRLDDNVKLEAGWNKERQDAESQRQRDVLSTNARIAAQRTPVFLRDSPGACPVPGAPTAPTGGAAGAGGSNGSAGGDNQAEDKRPAINAFESWLEDNFATCRTLLGPHQ